MDATHRLQVGGSNRNPNEGECLPLCLHTSTFSGTGNTSIWSRLETILKAELFLGVLALLRASEATYIVRTVGRLPPNITQHLIRSLGGLDVGLVE